VYALDSRTIDLRLSLFPWGKFRRRKSAVKLHRLLDLRSGIPSNAYVTGGQVHDVNILDQLRLTFLTNNFLLPALTIAQLCRARWKVELFSVWIKQHLRIKAFYGTSENAVKTQVWVRRKATGAGPEPVQNSADSQRHRFRKNSDFRGFFQIQRGVHRYRACIQLSLLYL
jgi:hypothetical protein